jgi:hypothetical protein
VVSRLRRFHFEDTSTAFLLDDSGLRELFWLEKVITK